MIAVGAIAALTALLYMIPFVLRFAIVWIWDVIVFILWIVAFGIFAAVSSHLQAPAIALSLALLLAGACRKETSTSKACRKTGIDVRCRCTSTRAPTIARLGA